MLKFLIFPAVAIICCCNSKISSKSREPLPVEKVVAGTSDSIKNPEVPTCILKIIDSIRHDHVWNPPAEIHEYEKDGNRLFAISADCCDRFTTVVDENCHYLCAPSGGFTGRGDGKCVDFFAKAKHVRLVWKDERVKK